MHILYLHGVGDGDPEQSWLAGLNRGMQALGEQPISADEVVAPRYSAILQVAGIKSTHPPITYSEKHDRDARRVFERRQAGVERDIRELDDIRSFRLNQLPDGAVEAMQSAFIQAAPLGVLKQVKNYLTDEGLRGAVLQQILDALPFTDQVILIGHSLGSVIAIDLLDHLPESMHVRRFITIGSPAGSPILHKNSRRILKRFPYSRVADWSNFVDPLDGVTAGRGLASLFPGAQDFWVKGAGKHASGDYLQNRAIATLVRDTVRPRSDLVHAGADLTARLSDDEAGVLLTLEFATAVGHSIPKKQKEVRERYEDALEVVRDVYVQELIQQSAGRGLPDELVDLVAGRQPVLPRRWDLSEVVARVVVLTYSNAVAPYEIDTGDAAVEAIPHVMRVLGYPSGTATKIQDAIRSVNEHLDSRRTLFGTKTRWAMAAAGVALLAAGPVGLAMAGAAGTVGAAAITSGLAAFGPGGMAGGLAMLSGLAGTGGMVTAAAATARPGNSAVLLDPTSIAIQVAIAHSLRASASLTISACGSGS
ncbi:MAG: hypothetical protein WBA05_15300 [Gordonia sp. (in: high G+C Gram-positive bacteria)]|uniref:hypothetical protein n=2 Tax=Gordonia sp. (in: high G+C Gram-positive bacteria) TaxID=84139 RepID=UPI003C74B8B2